MASVAILYSVMADNAGMNSVTHDELQVRETVHAVWSSLCQLGHTVTPVRAVAGFCGILDALAPDAVLNLAAGIHRKQEQAHVVGLLEMLPYPFTGSGLVATVLALDKATAKQVWHWHGIRTPRFRVFRDVEAVVGSDMSYPLLVKPVREGSGIGIHLDSVVVDDSQLKDRVGRILHEHKQPALVEEFIDGRELTVGVFGNDRPVVLPVMEFLFDASTPHLQRIFSYEVKVADAVTRSCPAQLTPEELIDVRSAALEAYDTLDCRDYMRIDMRLTPEGVPYVLEANTLPGLQPGYSEFPRLAAIAGWDYTQLIGDLLNFALQRGGNSCR